jgi:hypothetical protein
LENVAANVRFALLATAENTIEAANVNVIAPHDGTTPSAVVVANHFNSILMLLLDFVVNDEGRVVLDGHSTLVQSQLVVSDLLSIKWSVTVSLSVLYLHSRRRLSWS